ncbi:DNA-binding Lrp family transcriptional regulator [Motilibacter peucedani]|uniref:DNA-binding Lrp family transcriptional regulator n=1 Tax=Motilibacter peucedani TaxID=598650 RepID=A0A420XPG3_9ACTN|nr:Lrp/AsnC family transcriptional regulator [Motilibacter peucedani]RKS74089.1 DNA-binding Lrp family transcriptional regulator [Motilibacter peucedani]
MATLDDTDRRILLALDADPRVPVLLLAERLGLARRTVQTRLSRLHDEGLLRPHSDRVAPASLGYAVGAFVEADVDQAHLGAVVAGLRAIPEVLEVAATTGDHDVMVRVVARDPDDLYRVGQRILACPGIRRTTTAVVLRDLVPYRTTGLLGTGRARSGEAPTGK